MCGFNKIYVCAVAVISFLITNTISSVLYHKDKEETQEAGVIRQNNKVQVKNITEDLKSKSYILHNNAQRSTGKTWRVGRVSHKQYEIINMLWKSTTIVSFDQDTGNMLQNLTFSTIPSTVNKFKYPLKPSHIEFYYFNEDENIIPPKLNTQIKFPITNSSLFRKAYPSFGRFHLSDLQLKRANHSSLKQNKKSDINCRNVRLCSKIATVKINSITTATITRSTNTLKTKKSFYFTTIPEKNFITKKVYIKPKKITNEVRKSRDVNNNNSKTTLNNTTRINNKKYKAVILGNKENRDVVLNTPAQDKVKFFEMYDVNTPPAQADNMRIGLKDKHLFLNEILNLTTESININDIDIVSKNSRVTIDNNSIMPQDYRLLRNGSLLYNRSRSISWLDYPYVAAYIHEPSDMRCDAASLSAHWLVAAASCLSRYSKDSRGQSPFVTYCGESWNFPNRITYVKYSLLHPDYNPNDPIRRYKYNVGLIQVVASMSVTCPKWTPVPLMSHVFTAYRDGSLASAVGWGIDRYVAADLEMLPNGPLMTYDSIVYSDSCPGSYRYRKLKDDNVNNFKDVYCLLLPPYLEETSDPVHGALLMSEGKLIGLYLHEERRSWGEQSAEYTGIWRLTPWIQETAREPDVAEELFL